MPLTPEQIERAAQQLIQARRTNTPGPALPEDCRPTDGDSAVAIQKRVMEVLGETTGGWKCAVPKPGGLPILSSIPASKISSAIPYFVAGPKGLIEPEIAFVPAHDMPPRATPYTDDEIRASIGDTHYVIELLGSRYANKPAATPGEILADSFNNYGLWIGPKVEGIFEKKLDKLHVKITSGDTVLMDEDRPHPSGDPFAAYGWFVNYLCSTGETLKKGHIVTTGSYAGVVDAPLGKPVRVELGGIGVIEIELRLA
ncbi:MAG: 2-keto-4-pentenoate hydratase [Bryobacteraceae bacterium]